MSMYATGFMTGTHYARVLGQLVAGEPAPAILSVGATASGDIEVEVHAASGRGSVETQDAAYAHIAARGYARAAIICSDRESMYLFVLAPDAPADLALRVSERIEIDGTTVRTSLPDVMADEDIDVDAFFAGFADALDPKELAFMLEPGVLGAFDDEQGAEDSADAVYDAGHIAGILLAENLANLADGLLPINSPLGGAERKRGDAKFGLVHFPEGMTLAVKRWLSRTDLDAGVLVQHREDKHELRLLVPALDGTDKLSLACAFRYAAGDGGVKTSLPGYQLFGADEAIYAQFIAGVGDGMATHKRAPELDAGFGVLGNYQ